MAEFLLDTEAASRLMRAERSAITNMRQSGAKTVSFLARILIHPWDEAAAEAHARIRILAKRLGRSAGAFDIMIAAHADAIGVTLVTNDAAIKNLAIDGLKIISW